ncbi:hypothetical protein OFB94_30630, partial [Escherichia coli]|nr:hypothetical protein [Escherichia coli]
MTLWIAVPDDTFLQVTGCREYVELIHWRNWQMLINEEDLTPFRAVQMAAEMLAQAGQGAVEVWDL